MLLCTQEEKYSFNILYLGALIQLRIQNFKNFKWCKNKLFIRSIKYQAKTSSSYISNFKTTAQNRDKKFVNALVFHSFE